VAETEAKGSRNRAGKTLGDDAGDHHRLGTVVKLVKPSLPAAKCQVRFDMQLKKCGDRRRKRKYAGLLSWALTEIVTVDYQPNQA
jgi:hypothetical protein